jgi:hypothetical protein
MQERFGARIIEIIALKKPVPVTQKAASINA